MYSNSGLLYIALLVNSVASQDCTGIVLDRKYVCSIDSDSVPTNMCVNTGIPRGDDCVPFVGMAVTLVCSNATAVLYVNGTSLGTNATTYQYATAAISGLYECRGPAENASRHVYMQAQPAIGTASSSCTSLVSLAPQCCGPAGSSVTLPVSFNMYCTNCTVSLAVSWTNHIPVDLDLVLTNTGTVYTISRGTKSKTPYIVYPDFPSPPMARIIAYVPTTPLALCFQTTFTPTVTFSANLNTAIKGSYAVTTCQYSWNGRSYLQRLSLLILNFTMASGASYIGMCTYSIFPQSCSITNFSVAEVNVQPTAQQGEIINFMVNMTNLSDSYNGMVISCSLLYNSSLQWTNRTTLYLTSPSHSPPATPPTSASQCQLLCKRLIPGLLVPIVVTTVTLLLVVLIAKKLTRSAHSHDHLEFAKMSLFAAGAEDIRPPIIRSASQPDVTKHHNGGHQRRVRIYVSYSDDRLEWVTEVLRPILQRMIHAEVILRDDAMLVGQPISEERLRLILGAEKVLVVCSPEYEASPWCQYELLQSVSRDPRLTEGRVIPILCDGCNVLPAVINGVVSVRDDDLQFESKLRESVLSSKY